MAEPTPENLGKGPEDGPQYPITNHPDSAKCARCGKDIVNWHCANAGCHWCASCGERGKADAT